MIWEGRVFDGRDVNGGMERQGWVEKGKVEWEKRDRMGRNGNLMYVNVREEIKICAVNLIHQVYFL